DMIFTNELQAIREELCNCRVIFVEEERLPDFEGLLQQIEAEYLCGDAYKSIMLNLYITELLVQLCRHRQSIKPKLSGTDQLIYTISKYISTHFREPISLELLSQEFAMSASHLSRKFKAGTGIGINEYITYVRVNHAEKLLRETELAITEVAAQCGYSDSNYFSTVFKRVKGVSPQKYSKEHLGRKDEWLSKYYQST
ncbi:MAG: helix-turn-helix transcriptional regulator, partial [Lachnospiraceae bacterium]|nr:helix-turn-helix transcriptional regulator [Lachnospiraceae bacterium]